MIIPDLDIMKRIIVITLFLFPSILFGQECKVLVENIRDSYEGECKKGLAHGEGKATGIDRYQGKFRKGFPNGDGLYTWANGDTYKGEFRRGIQDGKGEMNMIILGRDSVLIGYWEDGKYIGEENLPDYTIVQQRNIENIRVTQLNQNGNQVRINFYRLGNRNPNIQNLQTESSEGIGVLRNGIIEYDVDRFPFSGGVTYNTPNKMGTTVLNVIVRFEINLPGIWNIDITN